MDQFKRKWEDWSKLTTFKVVQYGCVKKKKDTIYCHYHCIQEFCHQSRREEHNNGKKGSFLCWINLGLWQVASGPYVFFFHQSQVRMSSWAAAFVLLRVTGIACTLLNDAWVNERWYLLTGRDEDGDRSEAWCRPVCLRCPAQGGNLFFLPSRHPCLLTFH